MICYKCGQNLTDIDVQSIKDGDISCPYNKCPIAGNNDGDFLLSAAIGAATGSALLGGLLGGDISGGILGDMLDGDLMD
jgi:outer membrane lipoprotein SlyB